MWPSLERSSLREVRFLGNCPSTRDGGPREQDRRSLCKAFIRGARDEGLAVQGGREVLVLGLREVDLEAGTIRLDPGATKNDEGRVVYLTPELQGILREQVGRVMALMGERGAAIPYLFPHLSGRFAEQRIQDFRKT